MPTTAHVPIGSLSSSRYVSPPPSVAVRIPCTVIGTRLFTPPARCPCARFAPPRAPPAHLALRPARRRLEAAAVVLAAELLRGVSGAGAGARQRMPFARQVRIATIMRAGHIGLLLLTFARLTAAEPRAAHAIFHHHTRARGIWAQRAAPDPPAPCRRPPSNVSRTAASAGREHLPHPAILLPPRARLWQQRHARCRGPAHLHPPGQREGVFRVVDASSPATRASLMLWLYL